MMDSAKVPHVDCETCGDPTQMVAYKRCGRCWEIERRLESYLREGGERAVRFVMKTMGIDSWPDEAHIVEAVIRRFTPRGEP